MQQGTSFWKIAFKKKLITEMLKPPTLSLHSTNISHVHSFSVLLEKKVQIWNINTGTVGKKKKKKTSSGNINQPQMARVNFLHESFLPRGGIGSLWLHNNLPANIWMPDGWNCSIKKLMFSLFGIWFCSFLHTVIWLQRLEA